MSNTIQMENMMKTLVSFWFNRELMDLMVWIGLVFLFSLFIRALLLIGKDILNNILNNRKPIIQNIGEGINDKLELDLRCLIEIFISNTCIIGACFLYQMLMDRYKRLSIYNSLVLILCVIVAIIVNNAIDSKLNLKYLERKRLNADSVAKDMKELKELTRRLNVAEQKTKDEGADGPEENIGNKKIRRVKKLKYNNKENEQYLKHIGFDANDKANSNVVSNLRLISSICVLIMFFFFSLYYKTEIYMNMTTLMSGMVLGRFIYFDTKSNSLTNAIQELKGYWIYLLWTLGIVGLFWRGCNNYKIFDAINARYIILILSGVIQVALVKVIEVLKDLI